MKGQRLTQVKQYKYMRTTVEHTGQCKTEVANRINHAEIAFWKNATILRSNISMKTRIRIMMRYLFSVVEELRWLYQNRSVFEECMKLCTSFL